jgi:hypothetical protein
LSIIIVLGELNQIANSAAVDIVVIVVVDADAADNSADVVDVDLYKLKKSNRMRQVRVHTLESHAWDDLWDSLDPEDRTQSGNSDMPPS